MAFLSKSSNRLRPGALILSVILCTTPLMDGCSRGGSEASSAGAPSAAPSVATAPPALQGPPPSVALSPMAAQAPAAPNPAAAQPGPPPGGATATQLQELVAPIALYPDMLIAQILAASTYPTQVVEADRFMKQNPNLTGDALAAKVNPQPWDPSVKSLCQFPSVLATMSQSLAWTSALGEAYYNQPQDVMAGIQVMRKRAMDAGTLKSTPQQKVEVQSAPAQAPAAVPMAEGGQPQQQPAQQQVVVIQPAQPNTVYVPTYNPSTVYGAPVASPPGYSGTEMLAAGVVGFGAGMLLGSLINSGNNSWGTNWYGGNVVYNRNVWVSNSNIVAGRYGYGGYRPGYPGQPGYRPGQPGYRPGYPGGRPGYPSTLPANRPNLAANNIKPPNFPKPGTLPNRPGWQPWS